MPKAKDLIPHGSYCYSYALDINGNSTRAICPFWNVRHDKEKQQNGYCSYLKEGDWESKGLSLLWDMCKECEINLEEENEADIG